MEKPAKKFKKTPTKSLKKHPLKSLKRHLLPAKFPQSPKSLLDERFLRVKRSSQKKIVLPHQHERNLNAGIMKFLVPGLARGRMNSMYNEAKNTGTT